MRRRGLSEIKRSLNFNIPARHHQAILDPSDPIHRACDFLVLSGRRGSDLLLANEWMHSQECPDRWPEFLIAFASNGCGDFYAYDTRQSPAGIIYIDPDRTVFETLGASDKLQYETFEDWYQAELEPYTCPRCHSQDARFEASNDKQLLWRICPKCGFKERAAAIES
jgi:hypothetical protein